MSLPDIGSVSFDSDLLDESLLSLKTSAEPEQDSTFALLADFFRVDCRTSYYLVGEYAGTLPRSGYLYISMNIPDSRADSLPENYSFELFARMYQDGGMERLDNFEVFPATADSADRTVTVSLSTALFTDKRNTQGRYEAVFTVAVSKTE